MQDVYKHYKNDNEVNWKAITMNRDGGKTTRKLTCDNLYAGTLLTHAAALTHGNHQLRDFVEDLLDAIVNDGSIREIDFEAAKLREFLDAFDRFQLKTMEYTEQILGTYGEPKEKEESEE